LREQERERERRIHVVNLYVYSGHAINVTYESSINQLNDRSNTFKAKIIKFRNLYYNVEREELSKSILSKVYQYLLVLN